MRARLYLVLLAIISYQSVSIAQQAATTPKFYDFIKDDSLMMYFTDMGKFVEQPCAKFIRYTRLTDAGDFNGYFEDRDIFKQLVAKGHYRNGKKHGFFEEYYYPDAKLKSRGSYQNDKPFGVWEYFYKNGLPERTMKITESDTLVITLINEKGEVIVKDGNGDFEAFVQGRQLGLPTMIARGKLVNGKPDGEWTSGAPGEIFAREQFSNGRFVRGVFPSARRDGKYTHKSFIRTFFFNSYITDLELFDLRNCSLNADGTSKNGSKPKPAASSQVKYEFDMNRFSSELRSKMDKIVENDFRTGKSNDYMRDNQITIQFAVNEKGKAHDFRMLSGFGYQFYTTIISTIRAHGTFPPDTKELYFHLNLNFPGGNTYAYSFLFSQERQHTFR